MTRGHPASGFKVEEVVAGITGIASYRELREWLSGLAVYDVPRSIGGKHVSGDLPLGEATIVYALRRTGLPARARAWSRSSSSI